MSIHMAPGPLAVLHPKPLTVLINVQINGQDPARVMFSSRLYISVDEILNGDDLEVILILSQCMNN